MAKPHIEAYLNAANEVTIVYLPKVTIGEDNTPEVMSIQWGHIDDLITELQLLAKEWEY